MVLQNFTVPPARAAAYIENMSMFFLTNPIALHLIDAGK
jgi:hypothetical protein